jgi:hypothetical protein
MPWMASLGLPPLFSHTAPRAMAVAAPLGFNLN